jgi:hypothetical protein
MSDANRAKLAYKVESTFATAPTGSAYDLVRFTSESLHQETQTVVSAEVRSDRNIADVIRSGFSAAGDCAFELSYGAFDTWMQYALLSAGWSSPVTVTGTGIALVGTDYEFFDGSTHTITDSGNGLAGFSVGEWVKITAASLTGGYCYAKITGKAAGSMTLVSVSGGGFSSAIAGQSVTIYQAASITPGVALNTMTVERKYDDLTNIYAAYLGMALDSMSLSIAAGAIITGSFGLMGQKEKSNTSAYGTGYTAAATNAVMNGVDDVVDLIVNGVGNIPATSIGFQLKNNLRGRMQIGDGGPVSIGTGSTNITGTLQAYFANATMMAQYLAFTAVSLAIPVDDGNGKGYIFEFPSVKLTAGQRVVSGQNSDIIQDLQWTAKLHTTDGCMMRIARFPS